MQSVGGWHSGLKGSCTGKRWGGCGSQGVLPSMTRIHHYWYADSNWGRSISSYSWGQLEESMHTVWKESGEVRAIDFKCLFINLSWQYSSLATRIRTVFWALQHWETWLTIGGKLCREWMRAGAVSPGCTLQSSGDSVLRPREKQTVWALAEVQTQCFKHLCKCFQWAGKLSAPWLEQRLWLLVSI